MHIDSTVPRDTYSDSIAEAFGEADSGGRSATTTVIPQYTRVRYQKEAYNTW